MGGDTEPAYEDSVTPSLGQPNPHREKISVMPFVEITHIPFNCSPRFIFPLSRADSVLIECENDSEEGKKEGKKERRDGDGVVGGMRENKRFFPLRPRLRLFPSRKRETRNRRNHHRRRESRTRRRRPDFVFASVPIPVFPLPARPNRYHSLCLNICTQWCIFLSQRKCENHARVATAADGGCENAL